jgi:hypothetical protein
LRQRDAFALLATRSLAAGICLAPWRSAPKEQIGLAAMAAPVVGLSKALREGY